MKSLTPVVQGSLKGPGNSMVLFAVFRCLTLKHSDTNRNGILKTLTNNKKHSRWKFLSFWSTNKSKQWSKKKIKTPVRGLINYEVEICNLDLKKQVKQRFLLFDKVLQHSVFLNLCTYDFLLMYTLQKKLRNTTLIDYISLILDLYKFVKLDIPGKPVYLSFDWCLICMGANLGGGGGGRQGDMPPPPHVYEGGGHNIKCPPPPPSFWGWMIIYWYNDPFYMLCDIVDLFFFFFFCLSERFVM